VRKSLLSGFTLLLLSVSASFAQTGIKLSDELFVTKILNQVYIVTHYFPWESNSLIIQASDQEIVLVDTPYDTAATSLMLGWIKQNLGSNKITAFNTGFHIDNLGGNARLRKDGIHIYGSDLTVKLIDERSTQTQQQIISWLSPGQQKYRRAYETMTFCKPDKVYSARRGLKKKIGRLTFEIYYPGESHSPDNVVVYVKELELLFGGCMIKSLLSKNAGFTGDANMQAWPVSVSKIQAKYPDAKIVIPHHGMWGDSSLIQHTLDILNK